MKTADDGGLVVEATDAFVDRTPIDWRALKARAHEQADRSFVDALQILDHLRSSNRPVSADRATSRLHLVAGAIAVLAAVQTAAGLGLAVPALGAAGASRTAAQVALAAAFALAALPLVGGAARDPRRLFLLGMLICSASAFARGASPSPWSRIWLEVFAPAYMWQFALDFPRVQRFAPFDLAARRLAALMWAIGFVALTLNIAVLSGVVNEAAVAALLPISRSNLFWRGYTIAMLLAVAAIFVRSRRAPASERRKVGRFALALTTGAAPFLLLGVTRTLAPGVDRWLVEATPDARLWIDAVVVGALLATPVLLSAAIVLDRPFEFQGARAQFLRRAGRRLALLSDRRHRRHLSRAVRRMRHARGNREVGQIAASAIAAGLGATDTRVLVADRTGSFIDCLGSRASLPAGAGLVALLEKAVTPLDLRAEGALYDLLPPGDREWLEAWHVQIAAAVATRRSAPSAVIVVGIERKAISFTRRDLWFVEAVTAAASAVWTTPEENRVHVESPEELAFECSACGAVQALPVPSCVCGGVHVLSALPIRIGEFSVRRRLGAGGMGVVYLGRDDRLDRDVALKTLPSARPERISGLQREAKAMASLNHDALATIYGLEIWRDVPVLVSEYFPNGTLADRLARDGVVRTDEAFRIGIALARALGCMHERGLLHGDVKPANVGFTGRNEPKLFDLGLSRVTAREMFVHPSMHIGGTLAYLSPEVIDGAPPSAASDLWSLAVLLLEAVSGRRPFAGTTPAATRWQILTADAPALCQPIERSNPELAAILSRALGPRETRFQTAQTIRTALEVSRPRRVPDDHRE